MGGMIPTFFRLTLLLGKIEDPKGVRRLSLEKDENISIHRTIKSTVNLDETSSDRNEFQMKRHVKITSLMFNLEMVEITVNV